jgi:lysyl-tRNA synthetase class 2
VSALPDGPTLSGRVEAVLDDHSLRVTTPKGPHTLRFPTPHGLRDGDLLHARVEAEGFTLLGHARPRDPHPFTNPDVRRLGRVDLYERLRARARALQGVREAFEGMGFLELETPSVVRNPGMDVHLAAPGVVYAEGPTPTLVAPDRWLITSPEYHLKRALAAGHPQVFELARCFRAGERGARHQPEFTMLEWYRAWASLDDVLHDAEATVRFVCQLLSGKAAARRDGRTIPLRAPFARLTVREAFAKHCPEVRDPIALARDDEEAYYALLADRIEPQLGWEGGVFLTRYPSCHASLARVCDDDPTVCGRAELYVAGLELCNAFDELTDPAEQRARFEADRAERARRGLPVYPVDEDFLAALEAGMPPAAGNALGFDRLLMLALGAERIDDVRAFPD